MIFYAKQQNKLNAITVFKSVDVFCVIRGFGNVQELGVFHIRRDITQETLNSNKIVSRYLFSICFSAFSSKHYKNPAKSFCCVSLHTNDLRISVIS